MVTSSFSYLEGIFPLDGLSCKWGQLQQTNLRNVSFLKSQFCWCQVVFQRLITPAVAVTTSTLPGCENSASSWPDKVPLSQFSCIGYSPDDKRTATKRRNKRDVRKWALGWWVTAGEKVTSGEGKEKTARLGQTPPCFTSCHGRELVLCQLHRGRQAKLELDWSWKGAKGRELGIMQTFAHSFILYISSLCFRLFPRKVIFENKYLMWAKCLDSTKVAEVFVLQPSPGFSLSLSRVGAEPVLEISQTSSWHASLQKNFRLSFQFAVAR